MSTACPYSWCDVGLPGHEEHDSSLYVPGTLSGPYRKTLMVGAGLTLNDIDGPRVYVHIVDEEGVDEDAYMTINEAVDLIDALIAAITNARSVLAGTEG